MPHGTIRGKKILSKLLPIIDFTLRSNVTFINEIPHVYSISQSVADALLQEYGIQSKVVPNGICAQNFSLRKHTGVHTPVRAIQVSRLMHEKKGQDLLIRAVKKLEGELSVDFIGTGNSMTYLQTLSEELGVTHLVRFLGLKPQSYIAEHLKDYDIFVQPSRYEGFGLTVAEALAANLPTLVSSGQGPEEIICGFHYGWVFQNGDLDDLTEKLKFIVSHYDKAEQKASTAHEYVKNTYDVSVTAKTYLKEYNNF
jgi:glycosyltransferase involved in cell wall biosynthesis